MNRHARRSPRAALLAVLLSGAVVSTGALAAGDAEFAIRWNPAEGGPASLEQIAETLRLPEGGKRKEFEVRYFKVERPPGTPEAATAIARERLSEGQMEAMYKLRSTVRPAKGAASDWRCPFKADPKHGSESESEVDVGWDAQGVARKGYSLSCEAEGHIADLLPAPFKAQALGCTSSVLRVSTDGLKVERWSLPNGTQAFEVSANGKDNARQMAAFERRVVRPLLARGVKPLQQSKTQLGSRC